MKRRLGPLAVVAGALTLAMAAGIVRTHETHAAYGVCVSDPIVTLSNGAVVTLSATISTDSSQVSRVDFYLHVPSGLSVVSTSYDANGSKEYVHFYADQSWSSFAVGANATVTGSRVPVTFTAALDGYGSAAASGWSGQTIWIASGS